MYGLSFPRHVHKHCVLCGRQTHLSLEKSHSRRHELLVFWIVSIAIVLEVQQTRLYLNYWYREVSLPHQMVNRLKKVRWESLDIESEVELVRNDLYRGLLHVWRCQAKKSAMNAFLGRENTSETCTKPNLRVPNLYLWETKQKSYKFCNRMFYFVPVTKCRFWLSSLVGSPGWKNWFVLRIDPINLVELRGPGRSL
jgi:hypothetical protein